MTFKIGYRTIKTALGTTISILLAQGLGFHNFASAGILTILCIKVTKRQSIRASWDRLLACFLAMVFSAIFFEGIAFHPIVIGLLLLFFIPTAVIIKVSDGIVSSSVIILHLFSAGKVTMDLLLNEAGIITIGIGVALIMNLYMPSQESKLIGYQKKIEDNFKKIFDEIVFYLRNNESNWDGKEITETAKLIETAKSLAFRDVENHFRREENLLYQYFKIREKQFEIIERVLPLVTSIKFSVEQGKLIADFIEELSENIHPGNTAIYFLEKLCRMRVGFESMELPKTREEFEARATLLHFIKEMEQYLIIKRSYKGYKFNKKLNIKGQTEEN